jgi:putative mRNA 3-end processing factor
MLLSNTSYGLYCEQADLYIDPWKAVPKAIITHGHSDHARSGSGAYWCHKDSVGILRHRLGKHITAESAEYGTSKTINGVKISLHPAGHIIGSAQIRLEYAGEVWVVSGDYKTTEDGVTVPWQSVACNHFITESTFGLPIYQFESAKKTADDLCNWTLSNAKCGITSVLLGYSLGKGQRILHAIRHLDIPVVLHKTIWDANEALGYSNAGCTPHTAIDSEHCNKAHVVIMPPGTTDNHWLLTLTPYDTALCSGWMHTQKGRNRSSNTKGFAMSDHADWPGLLQAVADSKAENIYVTHGFTKPLSKYLSEEKGLNAVELDTAWAGHQ